MTWCCFPKTLASHNSMQMKDDKVSNKTAYKQERQKKKRERETKIKIDSQKKSKFWLLRMCEKQKSLLRQISRKICLFFLQNSFLAILMLISRKLAQRRGIGEKCGFFRYPLAVTKELIKLLIFFNWAPRNSARAPHFLF